MANQQFYNSGYFLPTNYTWNIQQVQSSNLSAETKELLVQLYQNIGNMCLAINAKDTAQYAPYEFVTGQSYYNPDRTMPFKPGFRVGIECGQLPNNGSISIAHTIPFASSYTFTFINGAATDPINLFSIPLPYASATDVENIKVFIDATHITITTSMDYSAYTKSFIVLEYIKN